VLDASVYIDLNWAGIIPAFVLLPMEFIMVDLVRKEVRRPQEVPEARRITVCSLSGKQIAQVYEMRQQRWTSALSLNDLLSFQLAKDEGCVLLANDGALRAFASSRGVTVHGSLWVLDEMLRHGLLTPSEAANALEAMCSHGARFPKKECDRRLREWRKQVKGGNEDGKEGDEQESRGDCLEASAGRKD
jgi:predicted nucleic acid-binding protein